MILVLSLCADDVALDSESRVAPLKKEKKKLFNDLLAVKGRISAPFLCSDSLISIFCCFLSIQMFYSC